MLYHLDALLGTSRNASVKYRYLSRCFPLNNIPREYAWEIAVLANTPGILPRHVCAFMKWHPKYYDRVIAPIVESFRNDLSVVEAARANAASVTEQDGQDMLMAVIAAGRKTGGDQLPIYAWMWIKASGLTGVELARRCGVAPGTVYRWGASRDVFDPLTGEILA